MFWCKLHLKKALQQVKNDLKLVMVKNDLKLVIVNKNNLQFVMVNDDDLKLAIMWWLICLDQFWNHVYQTIQK